MSKDTVSVEVSEGLIKPIIEAKIQAAILREFKADPTAFIDAIVARAMDTKVAADGKVSSSGYQNTYTFLSATVNKTIMEEAAKALGEMMEEQRPAIKAAIKRKMMQARGADKIANAVVNGISESLQAKYTSRLSVTFETPED